MTTEEDWAGRKKKTKTKKLHLSFKCCKNYQTVFDWQGSSRTHSDKHPHPHRSDSTLFALSSNILTKYGNSKKQPDIPFLERNRSEKRG